MRYSITGATIEQVKTVGGSGIAEAKSVKIIFATLTDGQVNRLRAQGCTISEVGGVKADVMPPTPVTAVPIYTPLELLQFAGLEEVRRLTTPLLYGSGVNLAIIDSGINEAHDQIRGRVVYSKNFTSELMRDGLDHGTGVASIALVVAPQCSILNLKVLNDLGEGTEEEVILAVDDCIAMNDERSVYAPSMLNLSLGSPDDGNPNNPLRVACRAAIDRGIWIACSAGNGGPSANTITSPATERYVRAIGSVSIEPFSISDFSSRGPTKEGTTKPDLVAFGENVITASSKGNTATVAKSGTSFATPFISGLNALLHEGMYRQVAISPEMQEAFPTVADALREFMDPATFEPLLPYLTVKPQGVLGGKDNQYGYGLPLGSLIIQALGARAAVTDISVILQPVVSIAMLGMLGMMIKGMVKK